MTISNQRPFRKHDAGKVRYELLPWDALDLVGRVLTHGAEKYDDHNWRRCTDPGRFIGAALRHIGAHQRGEFDDPESKLPHLAHAACATLFALVITLKEDRKGSRR